LYQLGPSAQDKSRLAVNIGFSGADVGGGGGGAVGGIGDG